MIVKNEDIKIYHDVNETTANEYLFVDLSTQIIEKILKKMLKVRKQLLGKKIYIVKGLIVNELRKIDDEEMKNVKIYVQPNKIYFTKVLEWN